MGCIGHEFALDPLPTLALRDVANEHECSLGPRRRNPDDFEGTLPALVVNLGLDNELFGIEEPGDEAAEWKPEPFFGRLAAFLELCRAQHPLGGGAGEVDATAPVDAHDAFLKPLDKSAETAPRFAFRFVELRPLQRLRGLTPEREHERALRVRELSRSAETQEEHPEQLVGDDQRDVSTGPCTESRSLRRHERIVLADVVFGLHEHGLAPADGVVARKLQIGGYSLPLIADQVGIGTSRADELERLPVFAQKVESAGVGGRACHPLIDDNICDLLRRQRVGERGCERLKGGRALDGAHGSRTCSALGFVQLRALDRLPAVTCEGREKLALVCLNAPRRREAQRDHADHPALPVERDERDRLVSVRRMLRPEFGRGRSDGVRRFEVARDAATKRLRAWVIVGQREVRVRARQLAGVARHCNQFEIIPIERQQPHETAVCPYRRASLSDQHFRYRKRRRRSR